MAEREALTADYVRSILDYDPETGVFTWRERPREHFKTLRAWKNWNTRFHGNAAGTKNSEYWAVEISNLSCLAHRLAWLWVTGAWPGRQIDHIDGDKLNNRFDNLREATNAENMRNKRRPSNNTSGIKGVSWVSSRKKWMASISIDGKQITIGRFNNISDAAEAYAKAARELHGEFARIS